MMRDRSRVNLITSRYQIVYAPLILRFSTVALLPDVHTQSSQKLSPAASPHLCHLAKRLRGIGFRGADRVAGQLDEHILEGRPAEADGLDGDRRRGAAQYVNQHRNEAIAVWCFDNQLTVRSGARVEAL